MITYNPHNQILDKGGNPKAIFWTDVGGIEESAYKQIIQMTLHPKLAGYVAIMPDCHAGIGATIGSVLPLKDAVIPSAVGVDIGCGMAFMMTSLYPEDVTPKAEEIMEKISQYIPFGFAHRGANQVRLLNEITIPENTEKLVKTFDSISVDGKGNKAEGSVLKQIGTLGGGNHFIELQIDETGRVCVMIHSGSRNFGYNIANKWIKVAKALGNAPRDLEYLEGDMMADYVFEMQIALEFARVNRATMIALVGKVLQGCFAGQVTFSKPIDIHHNYVTREKHELGDVWVHRKGATKAMPGLIGIIPGSMGTYSYLVEGTTHAWESYWSCSHGAGRKMSRSAAKRNISPDQFNESLQGIYTNANASNHLDEAPQAYKGINEVMFDQKELVTIVKSLVPLINLKG